MQNPDSSPIAAALPSPLPRPLSLTEIDFVLDPTWFDFETSADVPPLEGLVGQPRAVRALELGLGIRGTGYNIFAVGLSGTHLPRLLRDFVSEQVAGRPTPPDWVYVNNFDEPDRPLALSLPAGQGKELRRELSELTQQLGQVLPRALQYQGFNQERERLQRDYQQRCEELYGQLEQLARERGLHAGFGPEGDLVFSPLRDDQPLPPEEITQLSPEEQEQFSQHQLELLRQAQPLFEQQQAVTLELNQAVQNLGRVLAEAVLTSLFEPLWQRYDDPRTRAWLDRVKDHMLDNLTPFYGPPAGAPADAEAPPPTFPGGPEYEVNVVVDNGGREGPPVLVEDVPTFKNLFGFVERVVDPSGRIITHFTQIKPGTLLQGNGGYVVFNLDDAVEEPMVWKELKRTLKNHRIHIDSYDPQVPAGTSGLKPAPIPLDVKLVVVGSDRLFYALSFTDPEFSELFKVKAELVSEMPLTAEACRCYAGLVHLLSEREETHPFDAAAVGELVRCGARLSADRRQVSADLARVADVVREADYWCRCDGGACVSAAHVRRALDERVYRSNWFAVQTLRLVEEGSLRIDPSGRAVGRVNSLTVVSLGDYAFGQPVRLTATAWVGQTGVINIERESRLSGSLHDKGMLIMEGYLRSKYAQEFPIGLGASLAFEQSYGGVDGDSASAAELFCLVSALAGVPLRQDVGVTGSVNQHGQIQSIGGLNEKIEGFFEVCRLHGLTGEQGVCFPRTNAPNLVLRPEVCEAVARGQFHLWAIDTLDEGLALLTGLPAGDVGEPGSVHGRVADRFRQIGEAMRASPTSPLERAAGAPAAVPPTTPPSPPPLPPHG
ncbi:MAG: AAA family ATPase [Planctomycetes bacterium]|nr:AAA family ATPase [Planctomycetota bacterium]